MFDIVQELGHHLQVLRSIKTFRFVGFYFLDNETLTLARVLAGMAVCFSEIQKPVGTLIHLEQLVKASFPVRCFFHRLVMLRLPFGCLLVGYFELVDPQ